LQIDTTQMATVRQLLIQLSLERDRLNMDNKRSSLEETIVFVASLKMKMKYDMKRSLCSCGKLHTSIEKYLSQFFNFYLHSNLRVMWLQPSCKSGRSLISARIRLQLPRFHVSISLFT